MEQDYITFPVFGHSHKLILFNFADSLAANGSTRLCLCPYRAYIGFKQYEPHAEKIEP